MSTFTAQHYNILAKEIREDFPSTPERDYIDLPKILKGRQGVNMVQRGTLADLALSLAKRFEADNPNFDPVKWLNACSPDERLYPLGELWTTD